MFGNASAIDLARAQFAFTVSFHFIFPALSIGLASHLAALEGLWLRTGREVFLTLFKYWLKIFAITFGWASCRASSWLTSLAPTGRYFRTRRAG